MPTEIPESEPPNGSPIDPIEACPIAPPDAVAIGPIEAPRPAPPRHGRFLRPPLVRSVLYVLASLTTAAAAYFASAALARALPGLALTAHGDRLLLQRLVELPFALAVALLFVRYVDRRGPASIGLAWPAGGGRRVRFEAAVVSLAPLATIGCLALWLALIEVAADLRVAGLSADVAPGGFEASDLGALLLLLVGFLVQGGLEELAFRGVLHAQARERWPAAIAAIWTSALFAAIHAGNPGFTVAAALNTFLAGMLLAALRERTGSLLAPTLVHGVWNFAVACLLSLPISGIELFRLLDARLIGPDGWTGGAYGPEGSWVLSPLLGIAIAWIARGRRPPAAADANPHPLDPPHPTVP